MGQIAVEISRSIKEGKWVYIEYHNQNDENTLFWAAVKDINPKTQILKIDMYNQSYSDDVMESFIYFRRILSARVIEGTTYELQQHLIHKIIHNYDSFDFLEYSGINERVLLYYQECYENDREASIHDYRMVSGIDSDVAKGKEYQLSDEKFHEFVIQLKRYLKGSRQKSGQKIRKLAINILAIHSPKGLYPIVYRDLLLNVKKKTLIINAFNSFNIKISENDVAKFQLSRYFDGSINDFISGFDEHKLEYIDNLKSNCARHEYIDERPYVFRFEQFIPLNIASQYQNIQAHYEAETLCAPLQCFFGINVKEHERKAKNILIYDEQVNIDQLRAIHNALIKDVVYVQGPPGTGKTATIINVILSCMFNRMNSLIVSNNNEAINNIYRKLKTFTYGETIIDFPVLRLGSNDDMKKTLALVHQTLLDTTFEKPDKKKMKECVWYIKEHFQGVEDVISAYEENAEMEEQRSALSEIIEKINQNKNVDEFSKSLAIAGIHAQLDQLSCSEELQTTLDLIASLEVSRDIIDTYLYLKSQECWYRLKGKRYNDLYMIFMNEDEDDRLKEFREYISDDAHMKRLLECFPFIISTNVSSMKLGEANPIFDLLIMDEASQCNNAMALLPLSRCKRALLVGDQNQLQPVIVINENKNSALMHSFDIPSPYDYKSNSILSTLLKIDTLSKFILLRDHYRCNRKIISFSNQKYYDNELTLCSKLHNVDALKLIDIQSNPAKERNTCFEEVEIILKEIKQDTRKHHDIAVITPFRKQADLIERELNKAHIDDVKVGTIHTFQGDEKQRIIISSGISKSTMPGSFSWLKNNQELLNVATTRAKENLTLICDVNRVKDLSLGESNDFLELIDYIRSDGNYEVAYHENDVFTAKVKHAKYYNTSAEEELLETLMQIKSTYGQIQIRSSVSIKEVFPNLNKEYYELFNQTNGGRFDFVIYDLSKKPLLIIEIAGNEQFNAEKSKSRRHYKSNIAKEHNVHLITIQSDYVRRYMYIKETIMNAMKA